MSRSPNKAFLLSALLAASLVAAADAQDMPLIRKLVEQQLVAELASHHSEETALYNEKSVNREKWTSGKVFGKKTRLASWTEQSKTWLWFEDPATTVTVELTHFAVNGARLEFALRAEARRARFKAWGRIPKLVKAAVGGTVHAQFEITGSTAIAGGGLDGSQITAFKGVLKDLRFHNDAAHPLEDLTKDALNDYIEDKNEKFRRSIEKAIDRVRFSKTPAAVAGG